MVFKITCDAFVVSDALFKSFSSLVGIGQFTETQQNSSLKRVIGTELSF